MSTAATSPESPTQRDCYIPVFMGQPADYREWRRRIALYYAKMALSNRRGEAVINLVSTLTGAAWRLMEDFRVTTAGKEGTFEQILKVLDQHFEYDSRLQLPADFDAYFGLSRKSGQSLMEFVNLWCSTTSTWSACQSMALTCPTLCRAGIFFDDAISPRSRSSWSHFEPLSLRSLRSLKLCTWCLGRTTSTLYSSWVPRSTGFLEKVAEAVAMWLWTRRTLKIYNGSQAISTSTSWTGATVYQITGHVRRELGMYSNLTAKKVGRDLRTKAKTARPWMRDVWMWINEPCFRPPRWRSSSPSSRTMSGSSTPMPMPIQADPFQQECCSHGARTLMVHQGQRHRWS